MKQAQRCPVCDGRGLVPNGFYTFNGGYASGTADIAPEQCRSCEKGIILIEEGEDILPDLPRFTDEKKKDLHLRLEYHDAPGGYFNSPGWRKTMKDLVARGRDNFEVSSSTKEVLTTQKIFSSPDR